MVASPPPARCWLCVLDGTTEVSKRCPDASNSRLRSVDRRFRRQDRVDRGVADGERGAYLHATFATNTATSTAVATRAILECPDGARRLRRGSVKGHC